MTNEAQGGDENALLRCYEDVALQLYLMSPRELDRSLIAEGWRIFHAIDSNVVRYYVSEDAAALREHGRWIGLGEIFRLDKRTSQQRIARRVANYPFLSLDPEVPLIALTPINREIRNIFLQSARSILEDDRNETDPDRMISQLSRITLAKLGDRDRELILNAIALDHRLTEAGRLDELVRRKRICGDAHVDQHTHSPALAKAVKYSNTTLDMLASATRRIEWGERFAQVGKLHRPAEKETALARDIALLARLEICNVKLREEGVRERLVYITGDNKLFEAAELYEWEEGTSFAKAFIRHPRAYLDEPEVVGPVDADDAREGETLFDWLRVILVRIGRVSMDVPRRAAIRFGDETLRTIQYVTKENPDAASEILEKWREFAKKVDDHSVAPRSRIRELIQAIDSEEAGRAIEDVKAEIEMEIGKAWETVFHVGSAVRFAFEVGVPDDDGASIPNREVPCLVLEQRNELTHFVRRAEDWLADPASFSHENYEALRERVRGEDDSGYGDYIAHAYLMAQQSQWKTAGILAGRATSRARTEIGGPFFSNGRESRYIEAYCGRLASKTKSDMITARQLIESAIEIEKEEQRIAEGDHEAVPERFIVERAVIDLAEALYDWQAGRQDTGALVKLRQDVAPIRTELDELRLRVVTKLENLEHRQLGREYDRERIRRGLLSTLGRCYRSSLGLDFQLGDFDERARARWLGLRELVSNEPCPSRFCEFVSALGDIVFDEKMALVHKMRSLDLLRLRPPLPVMPYDTDRYEAMIAAARTHLAA